MSLIRVAVVALIVATPAPAAADDAQCATAYENVQTLRRGGKLIAAREAALGCAQASCPEVARKDCVSWVEDLQREIPTVLVTVRHEDERDAPVRVLVDGALAAQAASGRSFELDPGRHVVRAERAGDPPVETTITLHQGEHDRPVRLSLGQPKPMSILAPPPARAPLAPETRGPRTTGLVVGGASAIVLGLSAYLGLSARGDLSDLRGSCAPACADSEVDPIRRRLIVSDVMLGVGIVGAVVALYLFLKP